MLILMTIALGTLAVALFFHLFKLSNKLGDLEITLNSLHNRLHEKWHDEREAISKEKKLPPANRYPRTAEQRKKASQQRKDWWEKKRAADALKQKQP